MYNVRLLEISPEYFGHSVSFIGPKNEMYCDVLSDRLIFYRKNPIDPTVFRNSVMSNVIRFWVVWLVVLRIYIASAVFQPYRDLKAGDNQSLKIQVARRESKPSPSCSASQELNHSATNAPNSLLGA